MKLLILGGPRFLGYHLIEAAQARGHEITLFNRGKTYAERFPEIERIVGDRDGGLHALEEHILNGRTWDAVIDTCGYVPRIVRASAELLAHAAEHYTFVSSISVYADPSVWQMDETAPLATLEDETVEEITGETYGGLKVLCEQAAEAMMPGRVLNVRPGLIVGPHDPSDRFTYWPVRFARGGEILVPAVPEYTTQIIDARDLSVWLIGMVEARKTGYYHATGPAEPLSFGELFQTCQTLSPAGSALTWVSEPFLLAQNVGAFVELPLWVPEEAAGMMNVSLDKALREGLTFRPLADTVRDTLTWYASRPGNEDLLAGMKPTREKELLQKWRAVSA